MLVTELLFLNGLFCFILRHLRVFVSKTKVLLNKLKKFKWSYLLHNCSLSCALLLLGARNLG